MLHEADALETTEVDAAKEKMQAIRDSIRSVADQLNRLMDAYVQGVLNLAEYREAKNKLMDEKRQLEEQLTAIERDRSSTFEPLKEFLNAAKYAGILAENGSDEEKRDFLTKAAFEPDHFESSPLRRSTRCVATRCKSRSCCPTQRRGGNFRRGVSW